MEQALKGIASMFAREGAQVFGSDINEKAAKALVNCATKGGVYSMSIQMASEGGQYGIRVNTISPALVHTAATDHLVQDPDFLKFLNEKHMVGRIGKPEGIVYCVVYLASDESTWVTAADFPIDGGASKW